MTNRQKEQWTGPEKGDDLCVVWIPPLSSWGIAKEWLGLEEYSHEEMVAQAEKIASIYEKHGILRCIWRGGAAEISEFLSEKRLRPTRDNVHYALTKLAA